MVFVDSEVNVDPEEPVLQVLYNLPVFLSKDKDGKPLVTENFGLSTMLLS